jgi:Flp pilus assembly protein TadD/predicted aspartyl protease
MGRFGIFAAFGMGLLMALGAASGRAADVPPGNLASLPGSRARQLLSAGQIDQAERIVRAALASGADDALLTIAGEIEFRRANFTEAAQAFEAAISLNPQNPRAWWGLGRIEQAHFRTQRARDLFAKAFSLNHRDTDIILSYAEFVSDPASKAILLDNVARLASSDRPERAAQANAQLQIQRQLQGRTAGRLASPYSAYRLALGGFRPNGSAAAGVIVTARINGGRPLHLLLDTGARGIVIDSGTARKLDLETIASSRLSGFGDTANGESQVALARSVTFGDLAFEDCLVEVARQNLTAGADGIVGLEVFERFRIGVDGAAGTLRLTPFDDASLDASLGRVPAIGIGHLLLVKARVRGGKEGLFLVDTGAAFTTVSHQYLPTAAEAGQAVKLQGAQGALAGAFRAGPLSIAVGGVALVDGSPLVMDLKAISQAQGIEIAGILGYSTLGKSAFTIDLKNGVLEFPGTAGSRHLVTRTFAK